MAQSVFCCRSGSPRRSQYWRVSSSIFSYLTLLFSRFATPRGPKSINRSNCLLDLLTINSARLKSLAGTDERFKYPESIQFGCSCLASADSRCRPYSDVSPKEKRVLTDSKKYDHEDGNYQSELDQLRTGSSPIERQTSAFSLFLHLASTTR